MTSAVFYLHSHDPPVIHRDIKPENMLLSKQGDNVSILLSDFGFAKLHDYNVSQTGSAWYKVMHDSLKGTPRFMAPEFSLEEDTGLQYNAKVDVFSTGLVFAVLLLFSLENKSIHPLSGMLFAYNA